MTEKTPANNLWSFNYKIDSAPKSGIVRAADAEEAFMVAQRWAQSLGYRAPASVQPMIVADASILTDEDRARIKEIKRAREEAELRLMAAEEREKKAQKEREEARRKREVLTP